MNARFIKSTFLIGYLLVSQCLTSQSYEFTIDSLKLELKNSTVVDSAYIKLIYDIGELYSSTQADSTLSYSKRLLDYAIKLNHKGFQADAYNLMAIASFYKSDMKKVESYSNKLLELSRAWGLPLHESTSLYNLALIELQNGRKNEALKLIQESVAVEGIDNLHKVNKLIMISGILKEQFRIKESIDAMYQAYEISLKGEDKRRMFGSLLSIIDFHNTIEDYESINAYFDSLNVHKDDWVNTNLEPDVYYIKTLVYNKLDEIDSVFHYTEKCIDSGIGSNPMVVAKCRNYLISNLIKINNLDSAKKEIKISETFCKTVDCGRVPIRLNYLKAQIFMKEGKYSQTINICNNLVSNRKSMLQELLGDTYELLSQALLAHNRGREAYEALNNCYEIRNSLRESKSRNDVIRKKLDFSYELKLTKDSLKNDSEQIEFVLQNKLSLETKEKKWVVGGSMSLLFILGLIVRYRNNQNKKLFLEQEKSNMLQLKGSRSELKALRAQMNDHFLFNALDTINYTIDADKELAKKTIENFMSLIRRILRNSEESEISLEEELDVLEKYIQIAGVRSEKEITFKLDIEDTLDPELIFVPPLIFQPFIENSILHGFKDFDETPIIELEIKVSDNHLYVEIRDNGNSDSSEDLKNYHKKKSYGIRLVKDRLFVRDQKYKSTSSVVTDLKGIGGKGYGVKMIIAI